MEQPRSTELSGATLPGLVFCIDPRYAEPLAVVWQSLAETNPDLAPALDITVAHERLDPKTAHRLSFHAQRLGLRVRYQPVDMPSLAYNLEYGGTRANYIRLSIPDLISPDRRVLYLDADVLILGDLRPLLEADLGGLPLGAVRDPLNPTYRLGNAMPGWLEYGIPGDREYFNSGVLLLDLSACVADGLFERAWRAVAEHPRMLRLWDQDALNLAAEDRWHRLPMRWNTVPFSALRRTPWVRYGAEELVPVKELESAENDGAIIHFVSPAKPWRKLLPEGPARSLYDRHLHAVRDAERKSRIEVPE